MTDADAIEKQRSAFSVFSNTFYQSILPILPKGMNDKRRLWRSKEKEIRNPYFGNKMLKCGRGKEIIE